MAVVIEAGGVGGYVRLDIVNNVAYVEFWD